jgi:hypothetical protein
MVVTELIQTMLVKCTLSHPPNHILNKMSTKAFISYTIYCHLSKLFYAACYLSKLFYAACYLSKLFYAACYLSKLFYAACYLSKLFYAACYLSKLFYAACYLSKLFYAASLSRSDVVLEAIAFCFPVGKRAFTPWTI